MRLPSAGTYKAQSSLQTMNQKELKELIEFLIDKDITEFELERGDVKVRIKRGQEIHYTSAPAPMAAQVTAQPSAVAHAAPATAYAPGPPAHASAPPPAVPA